MDVKGRRAALGLALALVLTGCGPGIPEPTATPEPTPTPAERVAWLHGFYAGSSYSQIELAGELDGVSLGWARMTLDEMGAPRVQTDPSGGNGWAVPEGAELVTDFLDEAGVPYNLCVFANTHGKDALTALIAPEWRETAVEELVAAAEGYAGLTIDFEELADGNERDNFTAFMRLLRDKLPEDQTLYVVVPPTDWYKGYDYRALGEICDKVILMAHSYQWTSVPEEYLGTDSTDTPLAPIGRVEQALRAVTHRETGVEDPSKIALALSFGTVGVMVDEEGLLAGTSLYAPGVGLLGRRLIQEDAQVGWSEPYASPYVFYHNEAGERYRVWYEDSRSVEAKVDLALRYGVSGVSLWRLGLVPDDDRAPHYDVWDTLQGKR